MAGWVIAHSYWCKFYLILSEILTGSSSQKCEEKNGYYMSLLICSIKSRSKISLRISYFWHSYPAVTCTPFRRVVALEDKKKTSTTCPSPAQMNGGWMNPSLPIYVTQVSFTPIAHATIDYAIWISRCYSLTFQIDSKFFASSLRWLLMETQADRNSQHERATGLRLACRAFCVYGYFYVDYNR